MWKDVQLFAGWTVGEALRRASPQSLVADYFLNERAYRKAGSPIKHGSQAHLKLVEHLHAHLRNGQFDARNGDLLEVNDEASIDDPSSHYRVRWRAIMLRMPSPTNHEHGDAEFRPTAASVHRVESKASSCSACQKWLTAEMQKSPHHRPMKKGDYLSEAKFKWPDLSKRRFDIAWQNGMLDAPAAAWSAAGAPRK